MNSEKIGNWLQILGNFGLIAGLVLVAVQIRQNTTATEAQMISEAIAARNEFQLAIVGEDAAEALAKAIDDPANLTTKELIVLKNLQMANYIHRVRNERIIELGYSTLRGPGDLSNATVYEYLGNPFGMAWWQETSSSGLWSGAAPMTASAIEVELTKLGDKHHLRDKRQLEVLRSRIETFGE